MINAKLTVVKPMSAAFAAEGILRIDKIASGIGIILFHAKSKQAAGLHLLRGLAPTQNPKFPNYYADTGIAQILETFTAKGADVNLSVAVSGGATTLSKSRFDIAPSLADTVKQVLKEKGLVVKVEKTGGSQIRSMILDIDAGKLKIV